MRSNRRRSKRFMLTLGFAMAAAMWLIPSPAHAVTFILGADPVRYYTYGSTTIPAAPYNGQLVGPGVSNALLFFCIDESLTSIFGYSYSGTVRGTNSVVEEEAAFLESYALSHGAPSNDTTIKNAIEGPISMAVWQIMGNMSIPADPAAQPYILMAQNAHNNGQITQAFLSQVQVFVPDDHSIQRFMTAVPMPATPEPATIVLFMSGLIALGVRRFRRRSPAG